YRWRCAGFARVPLRGSALPPCQRGAGSAHRPWVSRFALPVRAGPAWPAAVAVAVATARLAAFRPEDAAARRNTARRTGRRWTAEWPRGNCDYSRPCRFQLKGRIGPARGRVTPVRSRRSTLLCRRGLVHLGKRAFKVLDQLGEAPLYRARTGNQNIIISLNRGRWPCEPHRLFEPPPRPVARDSAAEALGRGEAEARNMVIGALIRNTAACLQDKRGCHITRSAFHMQKLGTGLETSDGSPRLRHCRLSGRQAL